MSLRTTSSNLGRQVLLVCYVTYAMNMTYTSPGTGFNADEGASLLMAFRGLQAESQKQGEAHQALAKELEISVAGPFEHWAHAHRVRCQ